MIQRSRLGFEGVRWFLDTLTSIRNKRGSSGYQTLVGMHQYLVSPMLYHSTTTNLQIGSGKIETTLTAAGKTAQKDAVPWKTTRCAKILRTDRPGVSHHLGKSVVTRQGEHARLDGHVIFRHPADGKVGLVFLTFIVPAN